FIVTVQLPMPLHAPPQPERLQPTAEVAVRVTWVPALKLALQVEPQSIHARELVTLPPGLPTIETERLTVVAVKLAETLVPPFIVTTQLPEPLHAPPQPANFEPLAGVALNVTCVPGAKAELQVEPQSIPPGELV